MKTLFQTSCISSAMFITAMAANPLAVNLATEALGQPITWGAWALAGIVPGLICLAATPLILYVLYPPGESLVCSFLVLYTRLKVAQAQHFGKAHIHSLSLCTQSAVLCPCLRTLHQQALKVH